jgi:methionyl aminopeptidase
MKDGDDGYLYITEDGKNSAQFEETILITKNGPEILTK